MSRPARSLIERFWEKVDKRGPDECWPWMGSKLVSGGYGRIFDGESKMLRAHRLSWEIAHGKPVPEGMHVCHTCDNPVCVNPNHLFIGTIADNNADMVEKGRQAKGESLPQSKVTEQDVRDIRRLYEEGWSQGALGRRYDITQPTVYDIVHRISWKHVED